jgi:hypothetical protein
MRKRGQRKRKITRKRQREHEGERIGDLSLTMPRLPVQPRKTKAANEG